MSKHYQVSVLHNTQKRFGTPLLMLQDATGMCLDCLGTSLTQTVTCPPVQKGKTHKQEDRVRAKRMKLYQATNNAFTNHSANPKDECNARNAERYEETIPKCRTKPGDDSEIPKCQSFNPSKRTVSSSRSCPHHGDRHPLSMLLSPEILLVSTC